MYIHTYLNLHHSNYSYICTSTVTYINTYMCMYTYKDIV